MLSFAPILIIFAIFYFLLFMPMQKQKKQQAKMLATQQSLCDRYPDSTFHLNEYAGLAARCHRNLDKALDAAKRGVAVNTEPRPVAVIDTLAEVYFQRGEFKEAIAEEKKCIALCPDTPFHHKQLERFEEAAK